MKVALLRPEEYVEESVNLLTSAGFDVIVAPFLKIVKNDEGVEKLKTLNDFDAVIITSQTAAKIVAQNSPEILTGKRIIAIGKKTAGVLSKIGVKPDLPSKFDSATLYHEFADKLRGKRVLILRSDKGDPILLKLAEVADIEEIALYRIEKEWGDKQKELINHVAQENIDAVIFSSSMMVRSFMELAHSMGILEDVKKVLNTIHTIAIGPPTKRVLEEYGVIAIIPDEYTFDGVLKLLIDLKSSQS